MFDSFISEGILLDLLTEAGAASIVIELPVLEDKRKWLSTALANVWDMVDSTGCEYYSFGKAADCHGSIAHQVANAWIRNKYAKFFAKADASAIMKYRTVFDALHDNRDKIAAHISQRPKTILIHHHTPPPPAATAASRPIEAAGIE